MRYKKYRKGGNPDLNVGDRVTLIEGKTGIERDGKITEKGQSETSKQVMYKINFDDGNQGNNGWYNHGQVERKDIESQTPSTPPPSTPTAGRKRKTLKKKLRSKKRKTYKQ
jgi:hypothetical protein